MAFNSFVMNCPYALDRIKTRLNNIVALCFEVDKISYGLTLFTGRKEDCITPRGCEATGKTSKTEKTPNAVSIPTPTINTIYMLISISWSETFAAIIYLVYRLRAVHYLPDITARLLEKFEANDADGLVEMYDRWLMRITAYAEDINQPELLKQLAPFEDVESIMNNSKRITAILKLILRTLNEYAATDSASPKLVLKDIEDLIIRATMDFEYPLDASFFEYFHRRQLAGHGSRQLDALCVPQSIREEFAAMRRDLSGLAANAYKERLLSGLRSVGVADLVAIDATLFEKVGLFTAEFILDIGISIFNYVKAQTNRAESTKIPFVALQTILLQHPLPLTRRQCLSIWFLVNYYIAGASKSQTGRETELQRFFKALHIPE